MGRKKKSINPEIGGKIKKIRKQHNLTQPQFGELFSVTEQTVRNWESGRREIDLETVRQICEYFGCDMSYILGIDTILENTIDSDIDLILSDNQIFISYLESIGIDVNIFPCSATDGIDFQSNSIHPKVNYRYEITIDSQPIPYSEKKWMELQERISKIIKLVIH